MEKVGVEVLVPQEEIAIGGLVEVLGDARRIVSAWRRTSRALRDEQPDLVILVDSPDFNLPLARRAKRLGIPVLYYISPQIWAWRRRRLAKIAKRVDRMAVIFPFEPAFYEGSGVPVEYVGHPLVDRLRGWWEGRSPVECRRVLGFEDDRPLVALLPGSRRNEVRDTLPLQLAAARELHAREPRARFVLAVAPSIPRETIDAGIAAAALPSLLELTVVENRTYEVLRAADVALAKPGTVTVEIALLGTPLVVAARVNPLSAWIMKRVVQVSSFTMPNLIAGETVVPEYLQEEADPAEIAGALLERLDPSVATAQRQALAKVRGLLGSGGAADRAADIALEMAFGSGGA
jgi:lipid-A-disaccharide synthase